MKRIVLMFILVRVNGEIINKSLKTSSVIR